MGKGPLYVALNKRTVTVCFLNTQYMQDTPLFPLTVLYQTQVVHLRVQYSKRLQQATRAVKRQARGYSKKKAWVFNDETDSTISDFFRGQVGLEFLLLSPAGERL